MAQHQFHILPQASSKNGVSQITSGLIQITDGVALRHDAVPQACQLRKDEPHPVSALAPVGQLVNDLAINLGLCIYKANKISLSHGLSSISSAARYRVTLCGEARPRQLALCPRAQGAKPQQNRQDR